MGVKTADIYESEQFLRQVMRELACLRVVDRDAPKGGDPLVNQLVLVPVVAKKYSETVGCSVDLLEVIGIDIVIRKENPVADKPLRRNGTMGTDDSLQFVAT